MKIKSPLQIEISTVKIYPSKKTRPRRFKDRLYQRLETPKAQKNYSNKEKMKGNTPQLISEIGQYNLNTKIRIVSGWTIIGQYHL